MNIQKKTVESYNSPCAKVENTNPVPNASY